MTKVFGGAYDPSKSSSKDVKLNNSIENYKLRKRNPNTQSTGLLNLNRSMD